MIRWIAILCVLLGGAGANAQVADVNSEIDQAIVAQLTALNAGDLRVASVDYRLATRAQSLCNEKHPISGVLIQDISQFDPKVRKAATLIFNLAQGPAIEGVVTDSPAARAGLMAGDIVAAIDGYPTATLFPSAIGKGKRFDRVESLLNAIDAALTAGQVTLDVVRDGLSRSFTFAADKGCISRVQLVTSSRFNADADGETISLSTAIVSAVKDDDELAFLIAHEMAHNVLGHRSRLEAAGVSFGVFGEFGHNASLIRETEMEADYLAVYLMLHAGYDPMAAPRFCRRMKHEHGEAMLVGASHLSPDRRALFLTRSAAEALAKQRTNLPLTPDIPNAIANF